MSNPVPEGLPFASDTAQTHIDPMAALLEARNEMHRRRQQQREETRCRNWHNS